MIYALIVLYNKKIIDSQTYNSINKYQDRINFVFFDNGKEEFIDYNKKYCSENKYEYYTLNENVGIAKAYNYVIDNLEKNKDDYLIVLDDDTVLNDEYINEMFEKIEENKYDVILPVIISDNKIISPANVQYNCRIKMIKNINKLDINKISAINSGMIVRMSVYEKIKYNDKMFLDYVDHDFMKKNREIHSEFLVMNSKINQNFARFQKNKIESEIFRFKIYLKDFKMYCQDCNNIFFYYMSIFKYKIHECIKYKTIKFLFL